MEINTMKIIKELYLKLFDKLIFAAVIYFARYTIKITGITI
jgi:hypothetical protein